MTLLTSDRVFTAVERAWLQQLTGAMIPASDVMPAASEDDIFGQIELALESHVELVRSALSGLEANELTATTIEQLKESEPSFIAVLQSKTIAVYYADNRVLLALGLPDGAPFPKGREVEKTDWSLLDPVKDRAPFYRQVSGDKANG